MNSRPAVNKAASRINVYVSRATLRGGEVKGEGERKRTGRRRRKGIRNSVEFWSKKEMVRNGSDPDRLGWQK